MTSEKNDLVEPEPDKDRLIDPSDLRELLPEAILSFFAHSGPQQNPVAEKITTENISQIIEARSNETNQEYNDRRHSRQMGALYLFLILLAGGIITVVFVFPVMKVWRRS